MQKIGQQLQLLSLVLRERGLCIGGKVQFNMVRTPLSVRALSQSTESYEDAIATLNTLQSNAAYIREARKLKRSRSEEAWKLALTKSFLEQAGITSTELSNLSVIHVAGTKGKGSTSAYCESILRHHGFRTGFFSSPHLVSVCERIRINGKPISTHIFSKYFWQVFNAIKDKKHTEQEMPSYFIFLTIMAFKIFLNEMIDVAIVEVGIGGEFDSTNILSNVSVVGITSLGLDHTALLGNSLSEIAWQKAGILKPSAVGFTVIGHSKEALKVLADRSLERKCPLWIAPGMDRYSWPDEATKRKVLSLFPTQQLNASLALQMTHAWLNKKSIPRENKSVDLLTEADGFCVSQEMSTGLLSCRWPGRNQILVSDCGKITYFLDGAHTQESMEACVQWFKSVTTDRLDVHCALLLNLTGDRDGAVIFQPLLSCNFDLVTFSPNIAFASVIPGDNVDLRSSRTDQIARSKELSELWNSMGKISSSRVTCVAEALDQVKTCEGNWNVLVTGSLQLVGAVLSILDPNLKKSEGY